MAQVFDAKQTRPLSRFDRVWLRQTSTWIGECCFHHRNYSNELCYHNIYKHTCSRKTLHTYSIYLPTSLQCLWEHWSLVYICTSTLLCLWNDYILCTQCYGFKSSLLQNGGTALFVAGQNGHTSTVDALLRNGADHSITRTVSTVCFNN